MTISMQTLIDLVLLGPAGNRRQLQDSPILGDVWIAYASKPSDPQDLLITPYTNMPASRVASDIMDGIKRLDLKRTAGQAADIAYLHGFVAARLFFREVLVVIIPKTSWWWNRKVSSKRDPYTPDDLRKKVETVMKWLRANNEDIQTFDVRDFDDFSPWDRYAVLAGILLLIGKKKKIKSSADLEDVVDPDAVIKEIDDLMKDINKERLSEDHKLVYQISLNRKVMPAMDMSVLTVKADAAKTLFKVRCNDISWAVIDSGIDGRHPAFKDKEGKNRIRGAYDFSLIRKIVSLAPTDTRTNEFKARLKTLVHDRKNELAEDLSDKEAIEILKELAAENASRNRPINWDAVEKLIKIKPETKPRSVHGTHVAGIIGANSEYPREQDDEQPTGLNGMCTDINLYDFRVITNTLEDTEFAVIAALQYIRFLNQRNASYISIHGANLSLAIPHDVRNYACGRTPVCNECERLVDNGVVVVAAAGNRGYQRFETMDGSYDGYTAFSIADPGNADEVITVGATHRYKPHTYGVSFFSSRGPTGDGRLKPDLVAPGERIQSCLPDNDWGALDGTSMAAPHVSGAAAMLMGRYDELRGNPRRIKTILCESATNLGRERSFQGYGMLDVLRAFQSI